VLREELDVEGEFTGWRKAIPETVSLHGKRQILAKE